MVDHRFLLEEVFLSIKVLFGHDWVAFLLLLDLAWREADVFADLSGQLWLTASLILSQPLLAAHFYLNSCSLYRSSIHLFVFWFIVSALRINIMCKQILSINRSTNCWINVSITIWVKCRPSKIGCNC